MTESIAEKANTLIRALVAALTPAPDQDLSQADTLAATDAHVGIENMAAALIGRTWRTATAAQRARLCAALLVTVTRNLADLFRHRPRLGRPRIHASDDMDRWRVSTLLTLPAGQSVPVTWRIERNSGSPQIYDVTIDGVSMLESLRAQLAGILTNEGVDAVSSRLEAMNDRG